MPAGSDPNPLLPVCAFLLHLEDGNVAVLGTRPFATGEMMRPPTSQLKSLSRRLWKPVEALRSGRIREGLEALTKVYQERDWLDRLMMADALLNVKGPSHAEGLLKRALEDSHLAPIFRAMAYGSLGTAFGYRHRFSEAVTSFERALHFAQDTDDNDLISELQLGLVAAKVDCFGPAAVGTLMADAFRSVQSTGDPQLFASLHFRVSVLEGRRGATDVAQRHTELGLGILGGDPNPQIESSIHLTASALSFITADLPGALAHAKSAIRLARSCGALYNELAGLCNAGQVCVALGHFEEASDYLQTAKLSAQEFPFLRFCLFDTSAQSQLAMGDLSGCDVTLQALASQLAQTEHATSFPQLESTLTRIKLLHKRGQLADAAVLTHNTRALAQGRGERLFATALQIVEAEILSDMGRLGDATAAASSAAGALAEAGFESLTLRAELERVRGRVLHESGSLNHAVSAFKRSVRFHAAIGDQVALKAAAAMSRRISRDTSDDGGSHVPLSHITVVEALAHLNALGGQPELLAGEAYLVLSASDVAERLALVTKTKASQTVVQSHNWPTSCDDREENDVISISLGTSKGYEFVLLVKPKPGLVASSAISALTMLVQSAIARDEYRREKVRNESVWPLEWQSRGPGAIATSPRMSDISRQVSKVARTSMTVLLTGDTGVGKEVIAREIHRLSLRSKRVFIPIVCIASGVLDSHLFGHKKGSFTGAVDESPGVIRAAAGGTLFLDEIGELTTEVQVKLLRFLESKEVLPVGGTEPVTVDVRIIAATNANLQQMVIDGKFREDLFYRLNVATFKIPPLRERREEIPGLVQHFLAEYSQQNHQPMPKVSDEAMEYLLLYRWPGNVRELRNEMERLAGMTDAGHTIEPGDLKVEIQAARKTMPAFLDPHDMTVRLNQPLNQVLQTVEKEMIRRVLNENKGSLEEAARVLGLSRKGLFQKRRRFGL